MSDRPVDLRIAEALERIADALEQPATVAAAVPEPGCAHPEKARVSFGDVEEFECSMLRGGCGYRSPALTGA